MHYRHYNTSFALYAAEQGLDLERFACHIRLPPLASDDDAVELLRRCTVSSARGDQVLIFDERNRSTAFSLLHSLVTPAMLVYAINGVQERLEDMQSMLDVLHRPFLTTRQFRTLFEGRGGPPDAHVTSVACVPAVCYVTIGECAQKRSVDPFHTAAQRAGTDKVPPGHQYQRLYSPLLNPLQLVRFSLLEIGLGCAGSGSGSGRSAGRSAELWANFFPKARLTILEFMASCVHTWQQAQNTLPSADTSATLQVGRALQSGRLRVKIGSQSDSTTLASLAHEARLHPFKVIIDDGGHENKLMLPSFYALWPYLRAGGMYFIEDMMTSYKFRDAKPLGSPGTSIHLIKSLLPFLLCKHTPWSGSVACNDVALVHCRLEHCVVRKYSR
mmetsp:Transcript_21718/g.35841  ORF Transcript_21718/g.35841 Transcript_21718/m.35841 type:complete len:386 (+) Transcript_21718:110-1267(+)|eukprot:CAMPEP_0119321684 /NCGR_PEP_ID=MMETSP1333-20130426/56100_1 /TAXON_ID=418940 /ORGANISM="Scyphosphaera apsteinii, Strain RCC1455" /LENGTH=385 /DNA_ID=CAMNT_0007328703 /DNA_START=109 /DNA_END=1266 /DNA_ORIENTATION=-